MIDRSRELIASLALAALIICLALPGFDRRYRLSALFCVGARDPARNAALRGVVALALHESACAAGGAVTPQSHRAKLIVGYVAVSFWAMLGTAPLTAFHFNQFSMVGLIANAVVVPIMGFGAVICGLLAAALSFVSIPLARGPLWIAGQLAGAGYVARRMVRGLAARVGAHLYPDDCRTRDRLRISLVVAYRAAQGRSFAPPTARKSGAAHRLRRPRPGSPGWQGVAARFWAPRLLVDAGWWTYQRYFNPGLRVTFLSVGEGDGAVVRFPGSRVMLIDGGGAFRGTFDPGERIVAPFLWSQKIMHVDYLV